MVSSIYQHEWATSLHILLPYWTFLPPPSPSHPSRLSQSTSLEVPASYNKFPLAIYFTYGDVYVSMLLSQIIPTFSFPHCDQNSVLYVYISFADWVFFFKLSYMSCLHVLKINRLSVALFANILSQSISCVFILFMISFAVLQKLVSLK